jgi:pyrimidine-specific ribonucleoside hydrolase
MIDVVWDMETQDPDDFLTLLLLLEHPEVRLKAVTITPGSAHQVGLVRRAVNDWFGRQLPIGAHNVDHPRPCVSDWHYRAFGEVPPRATPSRAVRCCCALVTSRPP